MNHSPWYFFLSRLRNTPRGFVRLILSVLIYSSAFCQPPIIVRPELEPVREKWEGFKRMDLKRPRVGVVLSGGGARGIAQIGVLKALERNNIPIDLIAATSLGSVVGGLYCSGYTPAELESLALSTDWDEVLSLTEDTRRTEMLVEQKVASDRSFLSLRFEGLEPVIPAALSNGQRLTNFLSTLTLQAIYHPDTTFDDLKVRFRAVATDLISGRRITMKDGSLAEALRASSTVPLLFTPVEKDSLRLVDGGLVSNIPVDVARTEGCDLVIAVNTTSGMRKEDELKAPWQTADQIMGIMMQYSNQEQLDLADIVITPDLGRHVSSDFTDLQKLVDEGERAAEQKMERILAMFDSLVQSGGADNDIAFSQPVVERMGEWPLEPHLEEIWNDARLQSHSLHDVSRHVRRMFSTGVLRDLYAEVDLHANPIRVVYVAEPNPVLRSVHFSGCTLLTEELLKSGFADVLDKPLAADRIVARLGKVLRRYREKGYSLARVEAVAVDSVRGALHVRVNEGIIRKIGINGGERTREYVVLREFPLQEGDVFLIDKANEGITNISGTTLFEYVHLEISYPSQRPELTIRLKERPSQLVSLGLRTDNERNLQGLLDIRDDNVGGTGSSFGITISGGSRNQELALEHYAHRLLDSYLTFNLSLFYKVFDSHLYGDKTVTEPDHWERIQIGEYSDVRYGGRLSFGAQLEKVGNTTVEFSLQDVRIKDKENAASLVQRYRLSRVRFGTIVDSKNSYPFPTTGIGMDISYEFAFEGLGSEVGYNALRVGYESFVTWGGRHTLHPKLTVGFADRTMPFGEQFRLGGRESMFGTREDDRRGRQLLLFNIEYRWKAPIKILFDTYLRFRYDLGTISEIPEQIKFSSFRHGLGAEIALDTPVGPGIIGAGRSFYFLGTIPDNTIQQGPLLFYFMIGYQL